MKRFFKSIISILLIVSALLSATSCAAPKLEDVRDTFVDLIERSAEVNRILFGAGLSVYGDMSYDEATKTYYCEFYNKDEGRLIAYFDNETREYVTLRYGEVGEGNPVYKNEEEGIYLYPSDIIYTDTNKDLPDSLLPSNYKYVRLDEVCTSINQITALASLVYSEDYLADVFETTMGSGEGDGVLASENFAAKYMEVTDAEKGKKYLVRADLSHCPAQVDYERVYDFSTMVIARNSRKSYVNVEISSFGTYVDLDAKEVKVGWSTVRLSFVKQNGEWRLDTPTY